MTTQLILLCHAATAATRAGRFPADEDLEEKALAAVPAFAGRLPRADRALAGRSLRTRHTAKLLGLAAEPVAELDDFDFGDWRGRTLAEVATDQPDRFATWLADPATAPPGGESIDALIARVAAWLGDIASAGRVVAVTHPAILRAAALPVLSAPAQSFWRIDAGPLAMLDLRHDGRRWALRATTLNRE